MTEFKSVFDFTEYKTFLKFKTGPQSSRKGVKIAMSKALKCQPTYVSQVLNGNAHFSLEQGEALSDFFGLTRDEKHFFLLQIQKDRAGTKALEKYFQDQMDECLKQRMVLTKRLGTHQTLQNEDQTIYYSSWHYGAIHMLLTIPGFANGRTMAQALGLTLKRTNNILEFLTKSGLAERTSDGFKAGSTQIRLGNDSPNILKHHTNWRMKAIESLDRESLLDLHYSAVVTLSEKDVARLKNKMLEFISETVKEIRDSKEEKLYGFNLDFFNIEADKS